MTVSTLLVLGGARSGKSRYAQARAQAMAGDLVFVATAQALDAEMAERIACHRRDRGTGWTTIEAPLDLAETIEAGRGPGRVLLIDCLTLWASNLILSDRDPAGELERLSHAVRNTRGPLVLVANEVGLGIVPDNALARRFRDLAGQVNQRIAADVTEAVFVAAGMPLRLK